MGGKGKQQKRMGERGSVGGVAHPNEPSRDIGRDNEEALAQHVEAEETGAERDTDDVVRDCRAVDGCRGRAPRAASGEHAWMAQPTPREAMRNITASAVNSEAPRVATYTPKPLRPDGRTTHAAETSAMRNTPGTQQTKLEAA
eukprot:scaffold5790_cov101-Isochrysis_galbana.AAC.2